MLEAIVAGFFTIVIACAMFIIRGIGSLINVVFNRDGRRN